MKSIWGTTSHICSLLFCTYIPSYSFIYFVQPRAVWVPSRDRSQAILVTPFTAQSQARGRGQTISGNSKDSRMRGSSKAPCKIRTHWHQTETMAIGFGVQGLFPLHTFDGRMHFSMFAQGGMLLYGRLCIACYLELKTLRPKKPTDPK